MRPLFPSVPTQQAFDLVHRNEELLRPGALAICDRLGHGALAVERFADGSLPVYAVGEALVLKVYPPFDASERDREAGVLGALEGLLPVPTPAVRAVGELEGWGYVLMDRLRGQSLAAAWPQIPHKDRMRLAADLGEALAVLHSTAWAGVEQARVDWGGFVAGQRRTAAERQRARGLAEEWLAQISGFLEGQPLEEARPGSLLHTEVMREHLLVEPGPGGWRLSGLFDFEPAMVGAPEYEFASVGLFFSCAETGLLRQVLLAYGYAEAGLDAELEGRLMGWALLHRYSHLPWYLRRLPPPAGVRTLEALAAHWWGLR